MAALQYADLPGYAAIIFRRTFTDLALPDAIMDRSLNWLSGTKAHWSAQNKQWTFPSGATLTFAYMDNDRDRYRYQSAQFQFVGFDELTQFSETQYLYLFSRLRRLTDLDVPLRMRSASNPGGIGHEWVKQRFLVEGLAYGRIFIPAKLEDNPSIEQDEYRANLERLDSHTRAQLLHGDWDSVQGNLFKREWFEVVEAAPSPCRWVRYWDRAATEPKPGTDPDYTVGLRMGVAPDGVYYIADVQRDRITPRGVEALVANTASQDGQAVSVWMEQEPGSSGVDTIDNYLRRVLPGYDFHGDKVTGSKETRARPLSAQVEAGNVKLVRGEWLNAFLNELAAYTGDANNHAHDDQVDAASGAFNQLAKPSGVWVV